MDRRESKRLLRALLFSFLAHVVCFLVYFGGKKLDLWQQIPLPKWAPRLLTRLDRPIPHEPPKVNANEAPLLFVQVSPAQTTLAPPKQAEYYSDRNSQAANQQADKESNQPKISGDQTHVPKTEDIEKQVYLPLQPAPPLVVQKGSEELEEIKAAPQVKPGSMQVGKIELSEKPDPGEARVSRPRTIVAALARQTGTQLPGRKMQQEGGVKHRSQLESLDAKATLFGAYDNALVEAISARWHSLLQDRDYAIYSSGRVVLRFQLHSDGRVSAMDVAENTVGEVLGLICEKAVRDPAPYPVWPTDLRRLAGDTRKIQFTFYYN